MTDSSSPWTDDRIRPVLSQLGKVMNEGASLTSVLPRDAELSREVIEGITDVSVTMMDVDRPRTVVFTGRLAVYLDERQYAIGFGPCLDAAVSGSTILVNTGRQEDYPEFSA